MPSGYGGGYRFFDDLEPDGADLGGRDFALRFDAGANTLRCEDGFLAVQVMGSNSPCSAELDAGVITQGRVIASIGKHPDRVRLAARSYAKSYPVALVRAAFNDLRKCRTGFFRWSSHAPALHGPGNARQAKQPHPPNSN